MTKTRWEEARGRRGAPQPERPSRREPGFWERMRALSERADFNEFLDYLEHRIEDATIDPSNPNAGALLRLEGRRSLFRVAEGLSAQAEKELKAPDDGPGGTG
jgi:hypothetical protein